MALLLRVGDDASMLGNVPVRNMFLSLIADGRIEREEQIAIALRHFKMDMPTLEKLCGVGVVVGADEIAAVVAAVVEEHRATLVEQRYRAPVGKMLVEARNRIPFAVSKAVREELDRQVEALLGPKTEADMGKKPKQKKGQASTATATATATSTATAATADASPSSSNTEAEQIVTPWEVHGSSDKGVDYEKLTRDFGCERITPDLLARMARVTGQPVHTFLRRELFYSHRDLHALLDTVEQGKPFYLYTGRGPSSESMHLGHLVPFLCCAYLQRAFNVPIVIQMTDDEKFLWKDYLSLEKAHSLAFENAKDIIAAGFDREKTFIFVDSDFVGGPFYKNMVKFQRRVTFNQAKGVRQ